MWLRFMLLSLATLACSARIAINEIHYNPNGQAESLEFIELWNTGSTPVDMTDWRMLDGVSYLFPAATIVPPGGFIVLAREPEVFLDAFPGVRHVYGPFEGDTRLGNSGERVALVDGFGATVDAVTYGDTEPWPTQPDGDGPSLELTHPLLDENNPRNWQASTVTDGTPGRTNSTFNADPLLYEVTRVPQSPLPGSNVLLTCTFVLGHPSGVTVSYSTGSGWAERDFGWAGGAGWTCGLPARTEAAWVEYCVYATASNGVAYYLPPSETNTYHVTQTPLRERDVVINEIMYHSSPAAHTVSYEYVELYNPGHRAIDLAGCTFESFRLPTNAIVIAPGGYLVIADKPGVVTQVYGEIGPMLPYDIALGDEGELLRLASPNGTTVSAVRYGPTNEWSEAANGAGPSLALHSPYLDPAIPANWGASSGYGTPGSPNSGQPAGSQASLVTSAMSPIYPQCGDAVHMTARILASTNVAAVRLTYRTNQVSSSTIELQDDGLHGDGLAADDLYGGTIPPIADPTFVWYRFSVELVDGSVIVLGRSASGAPAPLTVRLSGSGISVTVEPEDFWQVETVFGRASSSTLYLYLNDAGEVLVDDISITHTGTEYIANGTFATNDATWTKSGNHAGTLYEPANGHVAPGCERIVAAAAGGSSHDSFNCSTTPNLVEDGPTYQLSFAYRRTMEGCFNYYNGSRDLSGICINELLCGNTAFADENGTYSDWIELYNSTDASVPVGGLTLSDNLDTPREWELPTGVTIPAHGFLLLRADSTDQGLHTSFSLSRDGEEVGLWAPDGTLLDAIVFGPQLRDVSLGRLSDGADEWVYFGIPTPGAPNTTPSVDDLVYCAEPLFTPTGGLHVGPQTVTLHSSDPASVIRYTLDSTAPDSNAVVYSSPITILSTTVVRAYAVAPGRLPSPTVAQTYIIDESNTLPVVSVSTTPANFWDAANGIYLNDIPDVEVPVSIEFYEADGTPGFRMNAGAQIGGWNIYRFAQNPLNIYARGRYGSSLIEYDLFPEKQVTAFKRVVLRNGGDDCDDAMLRDPMMQHLAVGYMRNPIQAYRPVIVYINGVYWGIHNLRERYDEQYFIGNFGVGKGEVDYMSYNMNIGRYDVDEGDRVSYDNLMSYLATHDLSDPTAYAHVATLMDIDSFIDRTAMKIYVADTSWAHNDGLWHHRTPTGRWQWVTVDLDRGFEDYNIDVDLVSDVLAHDDVMDALVQNTTFRRRFVNRFMTHLGTTFAAPRVIDVIDRMQAGIAAEIPRHVARWQAEDGIPSVDSWNDDIEELREFARLRSDQVRDHLRLNFSLTGSARLRCSIDPPQAGHVRVEGIRIPDESFDAVYTRDAEIDLLTQPHSGWRFVRWMETGNATPFTLLPAGATWRYLDIGAYPGDAWISNDFDDSTWGAGPSELGYGEADEATVVSYGPESTNKYVTTYFRTAFTVSNPAAFTSLQLRLLRDDGAAVYLNGTEVERSNLPSPSDYGTYADTTIGGAAESTFFESEIDVSLLVPGSNIIAAEVHQAAPNSSDLSFNLELIGMLAATGEWTITTAPDILLPMPYDRTVVAQFEPTGAPMLPTVVTGHTVVHPVAMPWLAPDEMVVASNALLEIDPGTTILFPPGASMYVHGELHANGTAAEPIFMRSTAGTWGALCFVQATGTSRLSHVRLEYASHGTHPVYDVGAVSAYRSHLVLDTVHIEADFPVSCHGGSIEVRNCRLHSETTCDLVHVKDGSGAVIGCDLRGATAPDTDGVDFDHVIGGLIASNHIYDLAGPNSDGIDIGEGSSNVLIVANWINDCSDKGVSVGQASDVRVQHNTIVRTAHGVAVKDAGSHAAIDRCTFNDNICAVSCYEKNLGSGGGAVDVANSVISHASAASLNVDAKSQAVVAYSLSDSDDLPGSGNVLADPLFVSHNTDDYHLQAWSPCINAGDPAAPADPDGTRADMGAWYFDLAHTVVVLTTNLPMAMVAESYSATCHAIGGTGAYAWTVTSGTLPNGIGLTGDGALTGTPTVIETKAFMVEVHDEGGNAGTRVLQIKVLPEPGVAVLLVAALLLGIRCITVKGGKL